MSAQATYRSHSAPLMARRAEPIGHAALTTVADVISVVAPAWSVELSQAFFGESNLVIMPEDADDAVGPTFVIYRDKGGFCLDQVQWDDTSAIGIYASLPAATDAVVLMLAGLAGAMPMPSTLRH